MAARHNTCVCRMAIMVLALFRTTSRMNRFYFLPIFFPTGYTGVDWGEVKGGETVAIFGAGPVGIMAAKSAWLRGAARVLIVDTLQYRLDMAKKAADAEGIFRRLAEATVGDPGMPWSWEGYR